MISLNGNILDVQAGIICHQVNCQGALGAGLAAQLKNKYPKVRSDYYQAYRQHKLRLGKVIFTTIKTSSLYVANMCGQDSFHRQWMSHDKVHTDYEALESCLIKVKNFADSANKHNNLPIYLPYKVGCGLARGSWSIVIGIIQKTVPGAIIVNNRR